MKTGQAGIDLIKKYEGCRLTAYKCPAGVWTIGYGHTAGVKEGQIITQTQADAFLEADLERFEGNVNKYYDKYRWNQNEFDALMSFAFNLGSIDKLTAGGTRTRVVIAEKMLLYNKAAGQVLAGLTRRREEEQALFLSAVDSTTTPTAPATRPTLKSGSTGDSVKKMQQKLDAKGYQLDCDGIFGAKTLAAVMAFQKAHGLTVDGIVGAKTWATLDAETHTSIAEYSLKADGEKQISENFKVKEFRCKDGSDKILIDVDFVKDKLQAIRDHFGVPVTINSAYRTESYNAKVGGAKSSYHMKGQAFDIVVQGRTPLEVAQFAQTLAIPGIIQYNTFVHVDNRPTKYWARNDNGKVTAKSGF